MKKFTQKEIGMINKYKRAYMTTISQLYKDASYRKYNAENSIINEMYRINGYDYRVIGGNSMTFSCAYQYKDKDNMTHLVYHTAYNRYDVMVGGDL